MDSIMDSIMDIIILPDENIEIKETKFNNLNNFLICIDIILKCMDNDIDENLIEKDDKRVNILIKSIVNTDDFKQKLKIIKQNTELINKLMYSYCRRNKEELKKLNANFFDNYENDIDNYTSEEYLNVCEKTKLLNDFIEEFANFRIRFELC